MWLVNSIRVVVAELVYDLANLVMIAFLESRADRGLKSRQLSESPATVGDQ